MFCIDVLYVVCDVWKKALIQSFRNYFQSQPHSPSIPPSLPLHIFLSIYPSPYSPFLPLCLTLSSPLLLSLSIFHSPSPSSALHLFLFIPSLYITVIYLPKPSPMQSIRTADMYKIMESFVSVLV